MNLGNIEGLPGAFENIVGKLGVFIFENNGLAKLKQNFSDIDDIIRKTIL